MRQKAWSGPLPDPQTLAGYEAALPGSAERILRMTELAMTGPIETNKALAMADIRTVGRGQWLAAGITATCLISSITFFAQDNITAGITLVSLPLVFLVQSFLRSAFQTGSAPDSGRVEEE